MGGALPRSTIVTVEQFARIDADCDPEAVGSDEAIGRS